MHFNYLIYLIQVNAILKRLPYEMRLVGGRYVLIRGTANFNGAIISTDFGLTLRYDGLSRLTLRVPDTFRSSLCGMCGNFDGDYKNIRIIFA